MVTSRAVTARYAFAFGALVSLSVALLFLPIPTAVAQNTGKTVRHHKVEEQGAAADELAQAENDIDNSDYEKAEPLLKKYVEAHPENFVAWYDLVYVFRQLGKRD